MKKKPVNPKITKTKYVPSAEFYSQIVDSLQDYSIFTLDKDLRINSWSSGSKTIFGYDTEEVIDQHFDVIFTKEDLKSEIPKNEIKTSLKEGRAVDNRWHVRKDESTFYAYGLVFPLTGIDGELLGYVKILQDLTERKNSEEAIKKYINELEELNSHKESILAILSHDLRSPLSGIIGASKYLKDNFEKMKPEEIKEMLDLIYKSSNDELNMLDYLVEWARIKYAAEVFSPDDLDLTSCIDKVFNLLNETASTNSITLNNKIPKKTTVFADEKMLTSILQNIVSNAIKHSDKGGEVKITSKIDNDMVVVEIKDTGLGMSKETQSKLFTPQLDSLSKEREKDKGAGIGLLLAKGFLEKNGGKIWVKSIEGKGTSFYFSLPIKKLENNKDNFDRVEINENVKKAHI